MYLVLAFILMTLPAATLLLIIRLTDQGGTDAYYHFSLIDSIRANRYRFVSDTKFFLIKPDMPYPQLVHWCMSFLPDGITRRAGSYLSVVFVQFSAWLFGGFVWTVYPDLFPVGGPSRDQFLCLAVVFYVFTPYAFYTGNAKNTGLSARAVGLFLVEGFFYSIALYFLGWGDLFLYIASGLALLVILSSIFGMQCIFFVTALTALLTQDPWLLLPPVIGLALFILLFPRFSIAYLRGWLYHKYYYRKFSAKYWFSGRPSIWRDLVLDIWTPGRRAKQEDQRTGGLHGFLSSVYWPLHYAHGNSVVLVLFGLPAVAISMCVGIYMVLSTLGVPAEFTNVTLFMYALVGSALLVFLMTSFKGTRFLGEPERYVEPVNVMAAILLSIFIINHQEFLVYAVFVVVFLFLAFLGMQASDRIVSRFAFDDQKRLLSIRSRLLEIADSLDEPPRVLANEVFASRSMMSLKLRLVYGFMPIRVGGLSNPEVLLEDREFRLTHMAHLVRYYNVDHLLIKSEDMDKYVLEMERQGLRLVPILKSDTYSLFSVSSREIS
jgi:hypothetical protein